MLELVDSHCHIPLIDEDGADPSASIVERAEAAGVRHMLCVSVDLESYDGVAEIAARFPSVSASVGVHPNTDQGAEEPDVARLAALAARNNAVAIGETGLDYFRSEGDLEWQRERFATHIRAARETGLPIIVHTRDAAADVVNTLRRERADDVGGVMHCFVDDWDTASAAMDLGFMISFSGIVTFRNAKQVQDVARQVPVDRLLIETDSPWLAPTPHRGRQNEPAYVAHVAEFLAELREVEVEALAAATTENFFQLFQRAAA
ncbi:MAG: TatD family hydrolase [Gammaproteobacteria bacterium]|nr:TatD family hydrolase [Gammaproteobacteria bacterium]